jgi:hypothetical protein
MPRDIYLLSQHLKQPQLPLLTRRFLYSRLNPDTTEGLSHIPEDTLPDIHGKVYVYNSARAVFYAPSDVSGVGGMRHERIRAVKSWYSGPARYDCVFIGKSEEPGFRGLHAARVFLFFSFKHDGLTYPCALIHWFSPVCDTPCEETGMWIVEPDWLCGGKPFLEVIHLDSILRGAHLIGVSGKHFLPLHNFDFSKSLDSFNSFYVNKYVDHHAHEIAF